jgi:hypothetical protein
MGDPETRMMMHLRRLAAVLALGMLAGSLPVAGMFQSGEGRTSAAAADSLSRRNEKIIFYERSFRPSSYDAPVQLPGPGEASARMPSLPDRATIAVPETVQGFRIQVINTNSYDISAAARNALLAAFDTWWVYVMFDSPTYRVRIGDFQSRLAAKNALEQIQQKGFPDALLVPDKVILHLPPRMPLPQPIDSVLTH